METQRFKMVVAYRGTSYHGWQIQPAVSNWRGPMPPEGEGIPTIQETLGRVLASIVGHPVRPVAASRTDAGVHAKGQVAHFDAEKKLIPCEGLRRAANHRLPTDVLIRTIEPVSDDFDAKRCAVDKRYQYVIWNAPDRPLFFADLAWHRWQKLDVEAMTEAAASFVGEHDFTSFARPGHGRLSAVRTMYECSVSYRPPRLVIGIAGTGFLWNMVRIMVGTLVDVGLGHFAPGDVADMLQACDRRTAGGTAPAHGLYLHWIRTVDPATQATSGQDAPADPS